MQRALEIHDPGIQTIVVDRGRFGHRSIGVAWCGAMDAPALERALAFVRESPAVAAIEIAYGALQARFTHATRAALAGADCAARLDGSPLPREGAFEAQAGSVLVLKAPRRGSRTILAIKGGIDVQRCLGSRTTDVRAGLGGFCGRALARGDLVPIAPEDRDFIRKPATESFVVDRDCAMGVDVTTGAVTARVVRSHEYDDFTAPSRNAFWNREWTLTHESDRMGYRLSAATLQFAGAREVRSHAVFPGVIQVPPGGNPIVLMSDAHTTGGYPKIGIVIEEDLCKIAQMQMGDRVRFLEVSA